MRFALLAALGLSLAGTAGIGGCERELSRTEKVKVDDDSVKREKTTVTEKPDGTIVKEETESKTTR